MRNRLIVLAIVLVALPALLTAALASLLYKHQDAIVQHVIAVLNEDLAGRIEVKGSHISPFANFPYLSIDLEDLRLYGGKGSDAPLLLAVRDAYVGFGLMTLLSGQFEITAIRLEHGRLDMVMDTTGSIDLLRAIEVVKEDADPGEELNIHLKQISVKDFTITKLNQSDTTAIDGRIDRCNVRVRTIEDDFEVGLKGDVTLTAQRAGMPTIIKNKHIHVDTHFSFNGEEKLVRLEPSELKLEEALFKMEGTVDLDDDGRVDLRFSGTKPDFRLLMAFAPEELMPVLNRYDNKGKVYFLATVRGKTANGHSPYIVAKFGCENAFFTNTFNKAKVDELQFQGTFTAEADKGLSGMEFSITDFSSRPEAGVFKGDLRVRDFTSPDVDLRISSDFDLDFLAKFFEIEGLKRLRGKVQLNMKFHDIIDLAHPERSLEQINQAYFTELKVTDLGFSADAYHLPIDDIDLHATMEGEAATIHYFNVRAGRSDIAITGQVSDVPAIVHHKDDPITTRLSIRSTFLDLSQLTRKEGDTLSTINDAAENFSADLRFTSTARAFTESPNLPIGEFFIENLYAKFREYPHTLHDFHADVYVEEKDFRIIDFKGEIDKSDFHFSGRLRNYHLWFDSIPQGDTRIDFEVDSRMLLLHDLLTYKGESYLPEDYRHEEIGNLRLKGHAELHFKHRLHSADITIDRLTAKLKAHPLRLEDFSGRFHIEDEHLQVSAFKGTMGHSSFTADLNYYYGKDPAIRRRDNQLTLRAPRLDLDELSSYTPPPKDKKVDHDSVFNIYTLPFTDMRFDVQAGELNYHRYRIANFEAQLRTTANHYLHIDTLGLGIAGGTISGKGYFNGEDSNAIYFSPDLSFSRLDLGQLMVKFDNFGQDALVSDNLEGRLSGRVRGQIRMHADMVPIIEKSGMEIDIEVLDGRIKQFAPLRAMADYFSDKNLNKVAFDTLRNTFTLKDGAITIPSMTINTSLGFLQLSGRQGLDMTMDYTVRVPFKMVTSVAASKLFGRKKEEIDPEKEDGIIRQDPKRKTRFISIRITGTPDNYKIGLGKGA